MQQSLRDIERVWRIIKLPPWFTHQQDRVRKVPYYLNGTVESIKQNKEDLVEDDVWETRFCDLMDVIIWIEGVHTFVTLSWGKIQNWILISWQTIVTDSASSDGVHIFCKTPRHMLEVTHWADRMTHRAKSMTYDERSVGESAKHREFFQESSERRVAAAHSKATMLHPFFPSPPRHYNFLEPNLFKHKH